MLKEYNCRDTNENFWVAGLIKLLTNLFVIKIIIWLREKFM